MHDGEKCSCMHHNVAGYAVALIGLAFLLKMTGTLSAELVGWAWPILLIVAGGTKAMGGNCKCC